MLNRVNEQFPFDPQASLESRVRDSTPGAQTRPKFGLVLAPTRLLSLYRPHSLDRVLPRPLVPARQSGVAESLAGALGLILVRY